MKHVTQFQQGQWWTSDDGRNWEQLHGPIARQLNLSFQILQDALLKLADTDDQDSNIEIQLNHIITDVPKQKSDRRAARAEAKRQKAAKPSPITKADFIRLEEWLAKIPTGPEETG